MHGADAAILAHLTPLAFAFVLVLCRVSAAVMLMPGLGEAEPPPMLRAGFALALTVLLLPAVQPMLPAVPFDIWPLARMAAAELLAGGLLGWLARLVALSLPIAGQFISYMLGLSSVLVPDATFGGQGTATSRLFGIAAPVLILGSGLYALPLSALAGSYAVFPAGAVLPASDAATVVVSAVGESFSLALRLAAPFLIAGLVWQVALGLLARLVPTLQVFFIAQPGQILGGLLLLMLVAGALLVAWSSAAHDAFSVLPGL
ncbi:MAG TPA: flagellar biosynthetic protein FliR [Acetobacteraceae bacterium]|nr:flagellar biosynthetic protein FliR [Acetobacteraceae bacterium]